MLDLEIDKGRIRAVITERGRIECEKVVVCAGQWTRSFAGRYGVNVPLVSVEHQYMVTEAFGVPSNLPTISADPDRIQRVILNLLDNGIKFTPGGGQVTLTVRRKASEIEIGVQDTGRGLSDEEQERAFEPYYRGQGGGAGLGLTIARAIVQAHGGQMGIESTKGQGCLAWFTLPCNNC